MKLKPFGNENRSFRQLCESLLANKLSRFTNIQMLGSRSRVLTYFYLKCFFPSFLHFEFCHSIITELYM